MENVLCVKKRGSNWSEEEEIMLIEEALKVEDTLFGKMKGCPGVFKGKQNRIKESMWSSITETLNLHYKKERETECVKKKFHNIKQRAKDKISQYRHTKTGGGPAPPTLTIAEDALLQAFEGRPQIVGIDGGVDTDGTIIDNIPLPSVTSGHPDIDELLRLGTSSDNLQQIIHSIIPSDSILTDLNSLGSCVGTSHTGQVVTEKKKRKEIWRIT